VNETEQLDYFRRDHWRKIQISLIEESMSAIAFHEKAGRSQEDSFLFLSDKLLCRRVATVAMLPSALSRSDSFARCTAC
jgi:hypothetical protein